MPARCSQAHRSVHTTSCMLRSSLLHISQATQGSPLSCLPVYVVRRPCPRACNRGHGHPNCSKPLDCPVEHCPPAYPLRPQHLALRSGKHKPGRDADDAMQGKVNRLLRAPLMVLLAPGVKWCRPYWLNTAARKKTTWMAAMVPTVQRKKVERPPAQRRRIINDI